MPASFVWHIWAQLYILSSRTDLLTLASSVKQIHCVRHELCLLYCGLPGIIIFIELLLNDCPVLPTFVCTPRPCCPPFCSPLSVHGPSTYSCAIGSIEMPAALKCTTQIILFRWLTIRNSTRMLVKTETYATAHCLWILCPILLFPHGTVMPFDLRHCGGLGAWIQVIWCMEAYTPGAYCVSVVIARVLDLCNKLDSVRPLFGACTLHQAHRVSLLKIFKWFIGGGRESEVYMLEGRCPGACTPVPCCKSVGTALITPPPHLTPNFTFLILPVNFCLSVNLLHCLSMIFCWPAIFITACWCCCFYI